ncbi:MAG: phosphatidate cytidylyltransferase [Holosporales bacterium]|jgi:CDP-diglyceride synthetase|nr:phosphatidate cytidylyltransferase [Holosporales bacterium]
MNFGDGAERMGNELFLRTMSATIFSGISVAAIVSGGIFFQLLISVFTVLMLREWISINSGKKSHLFYFGILYIIVPMLFWLHESLYFNDDLAINMLWILSIVCSCDTFAYFGGRLLKGPKLAPNISPGKTWSGTIIGSIGAFVISCIYIQNFMLMRFSLIIASVFIILSSIFGDLLESKVKRILNIKDTGNILPGHGGSLDRLDSFLLATYAFILIRNVVL